MPQLHLINIARFVRDLLPHSEELIKFDRMNLPIDDFDSDYIVVDGSAVSTRQSTGRIFDGINEKMRYNASYSQLVTLEFYGTGAYENAEKFSLLATSQKAIELKSTLNISISNPIRTTDVRSLFGNQHENRVQVEFNVNYNTLQDVPTKRIDNAQFQFKRNK